MVAERRAAVEDARRRNPPDAGFDVGNEKMSASSERPREEDVVGVVGGGRYSGEDFFFFFLPLAPTLFGIFVFRPSGRPGSKIDGVAMVGIFSVAVADFEQPKIPAPTEAAPAALEPPETLPELVIAFSG